MGFVARFVLRDPCCQTEGIDEPHFKSQLMPSWSPDGERIVFVSNRDGNNEIYVMDADGGNLTNLTKHAANEFAPAWSP